MEIPTQYQPRQVLLQLFPSLAPEYPLVITRLQLQRIELRVQSPIMSARVRPVRAKIRDWLMWPVIAVVAQPVPSTIGMYVVQGVPNMERHKYKIMLKCF